jgi:hypothetical protein
MFKTTKFSGSIVAVATHDKAETEEKTWRLRFDKKAFLIVRIELQYRYAVFFFHIHSFTGIYLGSQFDFSKSFRSVPVFDSQEVSKPVLYLTFKI